MGKVKESWETVIGFPDYSVSNLGRKSNSGYLGYFWEFL